MKQKTRVAIYARVSTKNRGQDTENQLAELRAFVRRKKAEGWTVTGEYVDQFTGTDSKKRPEFQRLFADASQRRFDLVLFWSLDRFSREGVTATVRHFDRLTQNGVDWWSFREEYLRSLGPFAEAVTYILAAIARQEHIRISERTKAGLARAKRKGKTLGRPRVKVSNEQIFKLRERGMTVRAIAAKLGVSVGHVFRTLGKGN